MTNKERREVKAENTSTGWATDEKIQQQPTTSLRLIIIFFPTVINCTTNVTSEEMKRSRTKEF